MVSPSFIPYLSISSFQRTSRMEPVSSAKRIFCTVLPDFKSLVFSVKTLAKTSTGFPCSIWLILIKITHFFVVYHILFYYTFLASSEQTFLNLPWYNFLIKIYQGRFKHVCSEDARNV